MTRKEAIAELRAICGSRRSEYGRWENCGVEGWFDNMGHWSMKRWALPTERALTWMVQCRDMLHLIDVMAAGQVDPDRWPAKVPPWDEWVPRILRAGQLAITWAHRPSPDWTVPDGTVVYMAKATREGAG